MSQPRPLLSPPETEEQLLAQAQQLSGYTLGELAALVGLVTPENLKRDKGWIGVLLEIWLGASAGSKPEQDFAALGVELKTIPVDSLGRPLETTFVCVAPLTGNSGVTWETSHVRHKLKRVLWIPVEGERSIPLAQRRVGSPLLSVRLSGLPLVTGSIYRYDRKQRMRKRLPKPLVPGANGF